MFHANIEELTKNNLKFREVVHTGVHSQLVVMSLKVGEEIGEEIHEEVDQILFIVDGEGEALVGEERVGVEEDDVLFVPAGMNHNVKNIGDEALKLYTVYSPPEHEGKEE